MIQFYGKESSINIKIPSNVKKTALMAYKLRDLHGFKGGVETGWKRARQLSQEKTIPIEDLKFMRNWFARHIITSYPSYKSWEENNKPIDSKYKNKRGIISWLIWGGDPAFKWVNSKKNIQLLNTHFNKSYKPIVKL